MRTMNRFDYLNIERRDYALLSMPSRKGSVLVHSLEIGQVREINVFETAYSKWVGGFFDVKEKIWIELR